MTVVHVGGAFGIRFMSNQPLPEFQPGPLDEQAGDVATVVHWHEPRGQRACPEPKPFRCVDGRFELSVPGTCDFDITPTRIDVFPAPGMEPSGIRAYLVGSAVGAMLHLRGLLVFHGSAVRLPDGSAALFCGLSTAGKSTLAATLAAQGYPALADDLCALRMSPDGQALCWPGLARTKLWRDAVERLGLDGQVSAETRVLPDMDKHCLPVATAPGACPLSRLYEIRVDETSQSPLDISAIHGVEKITLMLGHVYRSGYLKAMGHQNRLLQDTAALARGVQVHRITRPRQSHTLPEIVDRLEAQWGHGRA